MGGGGGKPTTHISLSSCLDRLGQTTAAAPSLALVDPGVETPAPCRVRLPRSRTSAQGLNR